MAKRYELSAAQWCRIRDILPGKPGDRGRCGEDNRLFVSGVLWILRSHQQAATGKGGTKIRLWGAPEED